MEWWFIYLDLFVLIATCQIESMLSNWIHAEAAAECHPGVRPNWFSEKASPCATGDQKRMLHWQSLLRLNIACCNHSNVYFRPMIPLPPPGSPFSTFSALTWNRHCVGFLSPHSLHRNTAFISLLVSDCIMTLCCRAPGPVLLRCGSDLSQRFVFALI